MSHDTAYAEQQIPFSNIAELLILGSDTDNPNSVKSEINICN